MTERTPIVPDPNQPPTETPPSGPPAPAPALTDGPRLRFTDEEQGIINRLITTEVQNAVTEARAAWEKGQTETQAKAMRDGLREQQRFKDLADQLTIELEGGVDANGRPTVGLRKRLADAEAELKEWNDEAEVEYREALQRLPAFLLSFAPAATASGRAKRTWLAQADQAARDAGVFQNTGGGNTPPPVPIGAQRPNNGVTVDEERAAMRAAPAYNRF